MKKFSGVAKEGDVIRGYDFKPMADRGDSYIEGVVLDANNMERGYAAYKVAISKRVLGGEDVGFEPMDIAWIPHAVYFMEWDGRVVKVDDFADVKRPVPPKGSGQIHDPWGLSKLD